MENMLGNSSFSDVTLKVGEDTLQEHKVVLASSSKVVDAMFESGRKEEQENVGNLVEIEYGTAKEIWQYIHSGEIEELSMDRALDLYDAADRFDLPELKGRCKDFILKHIAVDDVSRVAAMANLHSDKELAEAARRVFKENSRSISAMEGWRYLAKYNPDLYADLVASSF